jgi:Family of unknown function (DUF6529)
LEQLIEDVTRGNVTEVKVVLATAILALAAYQLLLAATAYGWIRLPFLAAGPASWTHRASGDAIVVLTVVVAAMCVGYYGFDEGGTHAVVAIALLGVIALKVLAVRIGGRVGRLLPLLGVSLFALFGITWLTSAGDFLGAG